MFKIELKCFLPISMFLPYIHGTFCIYGLTLGHLDPPPWVCNFHQELRNPLHLWAFLCGYLVASLGLKHLPPGAEGSPAVAITLDQVLCLPWGYSFPCHINDLTELVELVEHL